MNAFSAYRMPHAIADGYLFQSRTQIRATNKQTYYDDDASFGPSVYVCMCVWAVFVSVYCIRSVPANGNTNREHTIKSGQVWELNHAAASATRSMPTYIDLDSGSTSSWSAANRNTMATKAGMETAVRLQSTLM